jgi:uncharacterized DUF497 family protein
MYSRRASGLNWLRNLRGTARLTPRANKAHVISLRKANKREDKRYEAQT